MPGDSPGDVTYLLPAEASYYKEKPHGHAFFYSESRFPGVPSLPRVPPGHESHMQVSSRVIKPACVSALTTHSDDAI